MAAATRLVRPFSQSHGAMKEAQQLLGWSKGSIGTLAIFVGVLMAMHYLGGGKHGPRKSFLRVAAATGMEAIAGVLVASVLHNDQAPKSSRHLTRSFWGYLKTAMFHRGALAAAERAYRIVK